MKTMIKGKLLFLGILLLVFGCTNNSKEKVEFIQIVKMNFENTSRINQEIDLFQTKIINSPTIIEIFANDLDYDKYERENAKREYYNLSDFQSYYSQIILPIIDSLKIKRMSIDKNNLKLKFKTEQNNIYILDVFKIPYKQGIILFDGKTEPIFWKGNESGRLDSFMSDFFN